MSENLHEYKCKVCGGTLEFDSALQKMKCPYCDSQFEMAEFQSVDAGLDQEATGGADWQMGGYGWSEGETNGMMEYTCKSCGGQIVGDQNTGATSCPYCGNQVVMMGQFSGALRPEVIIPFKLDKKAAKAKLQQHLQGKHFLPKAFTDDNHIDEIKGIYVPYWLFDTEVNANINYRATKVRTWTSGGYKYTETSFFNIQRDGGIGFDKIPADGSSKMDDELMQSIEPFNYKEAMPFQTAYMAGYLADKYDVTADDVRPIIDARVKKSVEDNFRQTVQGYTTVDVNSSVIMKKTGNVHYALYPIWLLNTSWEGKKYTFAMNGQTGKFVGDLPCDKKAFWRCFRLISLGISAAGILVNLLFSLF